MVLLIDWELKSATAHDSPKDAVSVPSKPKPKQQVLGANIFYKGTHFFDTGSMIRNAEDALKVASDDLQTVTQAADQTEDQADAAKPDPQTPSTDE